MTPEIRYARTSDGMSIAYWKVGTGPALVDLPLHPHDNVELISTIDEYREQIERIARTATYVKYDARGFASSTRSCRRLLTRSDGPRPGSRCGRGGAGAFCDQRMGGGRRRRTRVCRGASGARPFDDVARWDRGRRRRAGLREQSLALARTNWDLATRVMADATPNILGVSSLRQMHDMIRRTATQENYLRYREHMRAWDATPYLPDVAAPTLVTNDGRLGASADMSRRLASSLPHGSLVNANVPRGITSPIDGQIAVLLCPYLSRGPGIGSSKGWQPLPRKADAQGTAGAAACRRWAQQPSDCRRISCSANAPSSGTSPTSTQRSTPTAAPMRRPMRSVTASPEVLACIVHANIVLRNEASNRCSRILVRWMMRWGGRTSAYRAGAWQPLEQAQQEGKQCSETSSSPCS